MSTSSSELTLFMRWTNQQRPEMPDSTAAVLIYWLESLLLYSGRQCVVCAGVKTDSEGYIQARSSAGEVARTAQASLIVSTCHSPYFPLDITKHLLFITRSPGPNF